MRAAYLVAARRTPVAPRDAAFKSLEVADLADGPLRAVLADAQLPPDRVDEVVLGNALYGGGNPARIVALRAGLPEHVAASTIDTQCCAGLDAILLAASRVIAGDADVILAGGAESFSRAPLRLRRPKSAGESPQPYDQPPFTPWPERDPGMIPAAAALAAELRIPRTAQEDFAIESHRKAIAARARMAECEIVPLAGLSEDTFSRQLSRAVCARLPLLAGSQSHGLTAATIAVEADAAAAVLVVAEHLVPAFCGPGRPVRVLGGERRGGDPERPGLAPIEAATRLLNRLDIRAGSLQAVEVMEAFAAQAMPCIESFGLDATYVNRGGGALARGHPIGASGAILAVRLWHELQRDPAEATGLAAIAAAGGLGSAMLLRI